MVEFTCVSVLGGWQTRIRETNLLIGPVFNKTTELWAWQRENLDVFRSMFNPQYKD
jgi:hypothetical protein